MLLVCPQKQLRGGLLAAEKSDGVMVTWNLHQNEELPVIDYCHNHNKGVLIKKALASGHFSQSNAALPNNEDPVEKSFEMIFGHPGVSSTIVGTINPEHLKSNVEKAQRAALKSEQS